MRQCIFTSLNTAGDAPVDSRTPDDTPSSARNAPTRYCIHFLSSEIKGSLELLAVFIRAFFTAAEGALSRNAPTSFLLLCYVVGVVVVMLLAFRF